MRFSKKKKKKKKSSLCLAAENDKIEAGGGLACYQGLCICVSFKQQ